MQKEELSEVLGSIDITAYLDQEGIDYKETSGSSGAQLNLRTCPVCGHSKWKVFLNSATGLGNCFSGSCEAKFNKFSFIRAHTGLGGRDLDEHIKASASAIGWRPARKHSVAVERDYSKLKIPTSYEIPIMGKNLAYLQNRGIGVEIAQYFHLRFCKKGYFVSTNERGRYYQDYSNRVIIPVHDLDGNLVSFQGRDITGAAEKKYLFPPGFASTGEHLFNGMNVIACEHLVINEGVFDVIATKLALDTEPELRAVVPVGSFGKHLSEGQIHKLLTLKERGVKRITIMWDGELKALDDAIKTGLVLVGHGFTVFIAILPEGKDPNEVPASEVLRAFYGATRLTAQSAIKLRMRIRK